MPAHKMIERNESGSLVGEVESPQEKMNGGRQESGRDGATRRSVKAFQFSNVDNA